MPSIPFGLSSYERADGDFPPLPVVNMTAEQSDTEGYALVSRPGLSDRAQNMGSGPVEALFQRDNVIGTALFGISGGRMWRETSDLGTVEGPGPWSMAGYKNYVFAAGGTKLYGYNGTSAKAVIAFPDDTNVLKVLVGGSRAVCITEDGQFYWSDPLETDIEALDFATAENQPDRLLDALFIDDILMLFGAETVEFWPNTQSSDLPFQPLEGRVIEKGIRATGCAAPINSTFAWVTNYNEVCLGDENNVISNEGLQARIAASPTVRLFTFTMDGVQCLCLRLDGETQVWKSRTGTWHEFASWDVDNWEPQCFAGGVFGSSVNGKTMTWSGDHVDLGGVLERRLRFGMPVNGGGVPVSNLQFRVNVGQTPYLAGDYSDPVLEMRLSRNAGQTWGDWRQRSLGTQGNYRQKVDYRALGMASRPGFYGEARCTDPVPIRISAVLINEEYGGR